MSSKGPGVKGLVVVLVGDVGPCKRKLSHWECTLEGDMGTLAHLSLSLLPCHHEVNSLALPPTPCHDVLCHHRPKTEPSNYGLKPLRL